MVTRLDWTRWYILLGWNYGTIAKSTVNVFRESMKRLQVVKQYPWIKSPNNSTVQKSKRCKRETWFTPGKVAMQSVTKLYSLLTTLLHRCRDTTRLAFFEKIGFLFVSCIQLQACIRKDRLELWWYCTENKSLELNNIATLHKLDFEPRKAGYMDDDFGNEANTWNMEGLSSIIVDHRYLNLFAEHDVGISINGEECQRSSKSRLWNSV